jgi:tetratricopeptide (TPR) repeat protein
VDRLLEVGRTREARRLLAERLAGAPDDPEAQFQLARAALLEENSEEAREHLGRVLSLVPSHRGARRLLFHVCVDAQEYSEAEALVLGLLREDPDDADLLADYARLMLVTMHLDKARLLTSEALRREPEHSEALLIVTLLETISGNHEAADRALREVVATDPDAYRVAATLFYVLVKRRRFREAEKLGQELLQARPADADLVEALVELRCQTHWTAWPLYPFHRWGWAGVAGAWLIFLLVSRWLAERHPAAALTFTVVYLGLVVYSWTHAPLARRWFRARGL